MFNKKLISNSLTSMSALHKRNKTMQSQDSRKHGKGSNYSTGRWTEKEHYHFLLAVKDHGRDWKKIEQVVKTRSSTQARSHAQKVLKED
jgi:SHAQKYF class myb-like DNA-binding protein